MSAASAPNLQLSPQERLAFAHYFSLADPTNSGLVQGQAAVPFFAKSKLPPAVLGQIWTLADTSNNGFLTAPSFSAALRLIGHAQRGETPDESLTQKPGAPPVLEGIQLPMAAPLGGAGPMSPQRTGSVAASPPISIRPEDRARYTRIFASAGPSGGLLDGEKAKDLFVKSKLPFDKLGEIWNLADTKSRGALDLTDFIVGMHFIQATMNGSLQSIPQTIPPGLYEAAAGGGGGQQMPLAPQTTGGSASAIPRQLTGQQNWAAPLSPSNTGARPPAGFASPGIASPPRSGFLSAQRTGFGAAAPFPSAIPSGWAINAEEKAKSDRFFDSLDTEKKGSLEGQVVVPFFMQSKLSEQVLAQVWDLSDITQSGYLTRDEFAVAMHLINGALTGAEVPQELPANLMPPSLRNEKLPEAVNPQTSDTQKDLFSLMDDDEPVQLPVAAASAFAAPVAGAPIAAKSPPPAVASRQAPSASPFDDDFFGGGSGPAAASTPQPLSAVPTGTSTARMPTDQSAEYGNKTLQLNSTQKAVDDLQAKRSTLENGVAQNASSLAEIETRLSVVKSTHETESRLVKELEARRDKQAIDLKTMRDELISGESELSRLKHEKDEVEQQVMHDREEVRTTKKRMTEVQTELTALKAEVEKLRKEARQQKGMVAIAKKQLSTAESEQTKLGGEKEELVAGAASASASAPAAEAEREVATVPGGLEAVKSPTASVRSYNPFDRFKESAGSGPATPSGGVSNAALAGGALAGAAAATAGVGAMKLAEGSSTDSDPFGATPHPSTAPPAASTMEDPWGSSSLTPAAAGNQGSSFDDAFGDDFGSSAPKGQQNLSSDDNAAFDDAFGGFDAPSASAGAATTTTAAPAPAPSSTLPRADAAAPTADQVSTDSDVDSLAASAPAVAAATEPKGKTPLRGVDSVPDTSVDDSDDDDEGPEDLENYPRYGGGSRESPDEAGFGKAPEAAIGAAGAAAGLGAASLPPSDSAAQAGERFPELPATEDIAQPRGTAEGAAGGIFSEPAGQDGAFGSNAAAPVGGLTASDSYPAGFVSSQNTGLSDAFVDASAGDAPSQPATMDPTTMDGADLAAAHRPELQGPTGSTRSVAGSAAGDSTVASAHLSPSSSIKTRRAPPPAPMRGSTTSSSATAVPGTTAMPATMGAGPQQTSFDDFESSFADLGPTSSSTAAPRGSGNARGGFDDAFDDADFDFVPSFGSEAQPAAAPAASRSNNADAFGGFDDAFGDGAPTTSASYGTGADGNVGAAGGTGTATASGSSAFSSFEDAFAPPPGPPPPVSSLPTRQQNAVNPSADLAPPAAAAAAASSSSAEQRAPSPAAPDDAPAVRQLAAMGFPRHKVIAALEKTNYKVEKALTMLLD